MGVRVRRLASRRAARISSQHARGEAGSESLNGVEGWLDSSTCGQNVCILPTRAFKHWFRIVRDFFMPRIIESTRRDPGG